SAKRLTTLKKGSTVEVVGTNGGWLQIKYGSGTAYVSADFVQKEGSVATPSQPEQTITGTTANGLITGSGVRFRKSPDGEIMTSFQSGTKVDWLTVTDDKQWVKISYKGTYGYVSSAYIKQETVTMAKAGDVAYAYTKYPLSFGQALAAEKKVNSSSQLAYFLNPNNFKQGTDDYYQFLTLSTHSGATAEELNQFLKNILAGHGSDFIYAADKSGVNEVYLAAHAMLETGNGTSTLANGVYYKGKKVYNMFGVGAYDLDPKNGGAALAYQQKWYSPSDAIIGGAKWIANHYIYNATYQQDTLYKMRWNPDALVSGSAAHQYATDPAWADSQSRIISNMYMKIKIKNLIFNVTQYS
uniref:SH3 domain-containing protein n=2 Tax=Sporolactobacillus vineae TaxID=444463 RepID=UPI000477DE80